MLSQVLTTIGIGQLSKVGFSNRKRTNERLETLERAALVGWSLAQSIREDGDDAVIAMGLMFNPEKYISCIEVYFYTLSELFSDKMVPWDHRWSNSHGDVVITSKNTTHLSIGIHLAVTPKGEPLIMNVLDDSTSILLISLSGDVFQYTA